MAQLTVQKSVPAGLNPTYDAAAAGGDTFLNDGMTVLHVKNGGGSSINVTINSVTACDQGFDHDIVVAVPNGGERLIGPLPTGRFNDTGGLASVSYSAVTSVTVAAIQAPKA